jgi:hypothetical protein
MKTLTKKIQDSITPKNAYKLLADGNSRFVNNLQVGRDLHGKTTYSKKDYMNKSEAYIFCN